MVDPALKAKLVGLDHYLQGEIYGQDAAVREFSDAIATAELGLRPAGRRPKSLMLFLGPTGVGKTEIIERASEYMYGTDVIARIDGSELEGPDAVAQLRGSEAMPEGRLGPEVDRLVASKGGVILIDEIEKASPAVGRLLLQAEAARITLYNRRVLDLTPFHIICTSNLGTKQTARMAEIGMPLSMMAEVIKAACVAHFAQETIERFTRLVIFNSLTRQVVFQIGQKFIDRVTAELRKRPEFEGVEEISLGDGVFEALCAEGVNLIGGARPMRRTVENRFFAATKNFLLKYDRLPSRKLRFEPNPEGGGFCLVPVL